MNSLTLRPTRNRVGNRGLRTHRRAERPRLNLLPIQLIRDDANRTDDDDLHVTLDDWPASGSNPRSPKYLFAQNDNIYVKLTGPQGMGNDKIKVKVTSETDTTGITFDLAETSPGIYLNNQAPAKPLRLGTKTESKSDCVTIKTVNKEVLKFSLVFNGTETPIQDVMVGRAKFSALSINSFSSDATAAQSQAVTNSNFFDAGTVTFPDNVVAQGNAMSTCIQNAGYNMSDEKQASMLMIVSHGEPSGDLADNDKTHTHTYTGNTVTIYNTKVGNVTYTNGSSWYGGKIFSPGGVTWTGDVEWVWLDACSTLHDGGGGKAAWEGTMHGSPRPVHAILGAYKPVDGDLSTQISNFWTNMRDNQEYVINAYEWAMELASFPQPWAFVANTNDIYDKLKEVGRDGSGSTTYAYTDVDTMAGKADSFAKETFDSGNGVLRTELPTMSGVQFQKAKRMRHSGDLTRSKHLSFSRRAAKSPDGKQDFLGKGLVQTLNVRTSLTKDQAAVKAKQYLVENFPEFSSRIRLKEVSQRISGTWQNNGATTSSTNGYLVQFDVVSGNLPVWDNYASVVIRGNQVEGVSFRYYDEEKQTGDAAQSDSLTAPKAVLDCLNQALPKIKESLNVTAKYEVLKANLCYVNQAVAQGKEADLNGKFIPAWHLVVNSSYQGDGSIRKLFHVWVDANTGEFIGKKPY